jgi:hypothetical protein
MGLNVRTTRDEVLGLFRKWMEEGTELECSFSFPLFAAAFRAKVRAVSETELRLVSDDTTSELAVRLEPEMEFGYGDAFDSWRGARFGGLVLVLRTGPTDEDVDFIGFTERIAN